jgi:segregation and condensation protein A
MSHSYTIKLPQFEGPFDLLLFFIERDELDINDIPISTITNDFLEYMRQAEEMSIDLASEFILVAATLCRIKAKMLIPRKPVDEEGNEIDPREELVQRLLEYKRYKSVLDELRDMEEKRSMQKTRGNAAKELRKIATKALVDAELESLTLFRLLKAYEKVLRRFGEKNPTTVHRIIRFSYTIRDQQERIVDILLNGEKANFKRLFGECENRIHAIVTFLALLELVNIQRLAITVGEGHNNFWLKLRDDIPEGEPILPPLTLEEDTEEKTTEEE